MELAISFLIALLYTALAYGAPFLLFLALRKNPVSKNKFRVFCVVSTVSIWILFRIVFLLVGLSDNDNVGPAFIWGIVFYKFTLFRLSSSGRICDPGSFAPPNDSAPFSAPITPAIPNEDPEPTASVIERPEVHKRKSRSSKYETFYTCPSCGSLVPKGTYTCDCSYVFSKQNRWKVAALSLLLLLCISTGFSVWSYLRYNSELSRQNTLSDQLNLIKREYQEKQSDAESMSNEINTLKNDNILLKQKSDFIDENIVFVPVSGHLYHKYDCTVFQNSTEYYAFNVEYAIAQGYKPCPKCNPPQR